jgi:hypothetical protein
VARIKPDSIPKLVGVFPDSNIPMLLQSMTPLEPLNLALEMVTPLSKRMFLTNESAVHPFKAEASVTMSWAYSLPAHKLPRDKVISSSMVILFIFEALFLDRGKNTFFRGKRKKNVLKLRKLI